MMDDKKKKIADKIIKYMEEILDDEDPLYEDEDLFAEVKKPKVKVVISKKLKEKAE